MYRLRFPNIVTRTEAKGATMVQSFGLVDGKSLTESRSCAMSIYFNLVRVREVSWLYMVVLGLGHDSFHSAGGVGLKEISWVLSLIYVGKPPLFFRFKIKKIYL